METHMNSVSKAISKNFNKKIIINGLKENGFAIVDNLLGPNLCSTYRKEAEKFYRKGYMELGKSTRWDPNSKSSLVYDKHNVYSMQIVGGDAYFEGPRIHEYVVAMQKTIVPIVMDVFPEAKLSPVLSSNKLAVCTG
jgi:hypothetical protein